MDKLKLLKNVKKIDKIEEQLDTVDNEVVRLKDFLENSNSGNVSQEDIKAAVNDYLEENPIQSGATAEQARQLQTAYEHSQSKHVTMDEVNTAIADAQLSGGEVDLSGYATKTYVDNTINTAIGDINTILDNINGEVI